jgi:hypothetical protein
MKRLLATLVALLLVSNIALCEGPPDCGQTVCEMNQDNAHECSNEAGEAKGQYEEAKASAIEIYLHVTGSNGMIYLCTAAGATQSQIAAGQVYVNLGLLDTGVGYTKYDAAIGAGKPYTVAAAQIASGDQLYTSGVYNKGIGQYGQATTDFTNAKALYISCQPSFVTAEALLTEGAQAWNNAEADFGDAAEYYYDLLVELTEGES